MRRRRLLVSLCVACGVLLSLSGVAVAQSAPVFKLGFLALAQQIPSVVGQPLENEHWGANGDSLQMTSNGMMAWRKADNWTAFTNEYMTWINGPNGIQSRLNTDRFDWEAATPPASAPSPAPSPAPAPQAGPKVSVLNSNVIQGTGIWADTTWVMGEVRNDGDAPAYNVTVSAALISASETVAGAATSSIDYLDAGRTTAFSAWIKNPGQHTKSQVQIIGQESQSIFQYGELTVSGGTLLKVSGQYSGDGARFTGTLTNGSGKTLRLDQVRVWFLDGQGNVVWVANSFPASTAAMSPGASVPIDVTAAVRQSHNPKMATITQVRTYSEGMAD